MTSQQAREFIRHPANVPLEVQPQGLRQQLSLQLNNVSEGGLSFESPVEFYQGALVKIKIRAVKPVFRVHAVVQWCRKKLDHFELGVRFLDSDDAFRVRMVEQVCHIEAYRKQVEARQGRRLSKNQASIEWIAKHGPEFPGQ